MSERRFCRNNPTSGLKIVGICCLHFTSLRYIFTNKLQPHSSVLLWIDLRGRVADIMPEIFDPHGDQASLRGEGALGSQWFGILWDAQKNCIAFSGNSPGIPNHRTTNHQGHHHLLMREFGENHTSAWISGAHWAKSNLNLYWERCNISNVHKRHRRAFGRLIQAIST